MKKSSRMEHSIGLELSSLILFALAFFLLCSLVTFNAKDASWFSLGNAIPQNACGKVGAFLGSFFLNTFGLAAFLFPASFLFVATTLHQREGLHKATGVLAGMLVAVLSMTVFLTLQRQTWSMGGTELLTGGTFGYLIADSLKQYFNILGASIISLLVFSLALVTSTPVSLSRALGRMVRIAAVVSWRVSKILASYAAYGVMLVSSRAYRDMGRSLETVRGRVIQALDDRRKRLALAPIEVESTPVEFGMDDDALAEAGAGGLDVDARVTRTASPPEFDFTEESDAISISELKKSPTEQMIFDPEIIAPIDHTKEKPKKFRQPKTVNWKLPTIEFLKKSQKLDTPIDQKRIQENVEILKNKLKNFGVEGEVMAVRPGPVITLYEFKPAPGVKVARIAALSDDLAMALSATSVRILAPLPGRPVVGIEIPSEVRQTVVFREFFSNNEFYDPKYAVPVVMGKDIGGAPVLSDLVRMPHLLVAGQTGSGKSVFMNGLICSLLYRYTPEDMRLILVDPKYIEFNAYQDIPHLLLPVVDDAKEASTALKWAVREMERRYRVLAMLGARNLAEYNKKVDELGQDVVRDLLFAGEQENEKLSQMSGGDWSQAFESDDSGELRVGKLPFIVVIIDELADLMMIAKKEVEISIARIAQKARAAGIHLVIATQRPSTDVITGLIKANMPSRCSFQLSSFIDSKTILDRAGAEKLLGLGDMLFTPPGASMPIRLQGAYLQDEEIRKVVSFLKSQGKPSYRNEILIDDEESADEDSEEGMDEFYTEAVDLAKKLGKVSASSLQRHFSIGYNRAAKLVEKMEAKGIVGPADGARPREVLIR